MPICGPNAERTPQRATTSNFTIAITWRRGARAAATALKQLYMHAWLYSGGERAHKRAHTHAHVQSINIVIVAMVQRYFKYVIIVISQVHAGVCNWTAVNFERTPMLLLWLYEEGFRWRLWSPPNGVAIYSSVHTINCWYTHSSEPAFFERTVYCV